jgi:hypothetical protein
MRIQFRQSFYYSVDIFIKQVSSTREQVTEEEHIFTYEMRTVNWHFILKMLCEEVVTQS